MSWSARPRFGDAAAVEVSNGPEVDEWYSTLVL
jgi:hypothetical protein